MGFPYCFHVSLNQKYFLYPRFTDSEVDFLNNELINLESRGVVQRVSETPHCVFPLKVVPKPGGKFRLICDLRYVNSHCDTPRFSSEGIDVLPEIVRDAVQAVTLDLRDGFFFSFSDRATISQVFRVSVRWFLVGVVLLTFWVTMLSVLFSQMYSCRC